MARLVTLHDTDGEIIYPQSVWDENMIPDDTITANMINWSTLVLKGTWTTSIALSGTGSSTLSTVDISSLGFSSSDDYVVIATNRCNASNGWATTLEVGERTATSFRLRLYNSHWAGGSVGSGIIIDWAVFKVV